MNNNNEYTLLDKILMTLIFGSTLFSIGTEFYLFVIPKNKVLTFSELNPFQQKLYIGLFISLFIMAVSFIIAIIINEKDEDSSLKNYIFLKKEETQGTSRAFIRTRI